MQRALSRVMHGRTARQRASTCSSIETGSSSITSSLNNTLSAFPPPPGKASCSTDTTSSSPSASHMPRDLPVIGVELSVIPEYEWYDDDISMFLAIDIHGTSSIRQNTMADPVDVVALIDNSVYTSPSTLMESSRAVSFLASILMPQDRLAVLCTHRNSSRVLAPLGQLQRQNIEMVMDTIECSVEAPDPSFLDEAIMCAKDVLTGSSHGHVIVLTSNMDGVSPDILTSDHLQIHIVYAGVIPWKSQHAQSDGWQIRGRFQPSDVQKKIQNLISHSRRGVCGSLSDLTLKIYPGTLCSIESVMGKSKVPILQCGEFITALIKLRVAFSSNEDEDPLRISDELMEELDDMLGTASTKVLTAKLSYTHPMLPKGTRSSISAECRIKKPTSRSEWNLPTSHMATSITQDTQATVQMRLVYYLATFHTPRHALVALSERFGIDGDQCVCADYVKRVMDELKYQARVTERFDLVDPSSQTTENASENFGHGLFKISNYKPHDWVTFSVSPTVRETPLRPTDEARKIWADMRRMSRTEYKDKGWKQMHTKGSPEMLRRIQEKAMKNKRSIGADTLASLTNGARLRMHSSPWL